MAWNKGVVVKKPTPILTPTPTKNFTYTPPTVLGDNIEICKIKEVSNSRRGGGFTGAGFPEWITLTPSKGTVKWARTRRA